jgi:hypothetical protein
MLVYLSNYMFAKLLLANSFCGLCFNLLSVFEIERFIQSTSSSAKFLKVLGMSCLNEIHGDNFGLQITTSIFISNFQRLMCREPTM